MPLPEAFLQGREAFDRRRFFAAHEHWEEVWRSAAPDARPFYRALIQLAAACLKIEQQAYVPARRLLLRAQEGLQGKAADLEVELPALREAVRTLLQRLEALGPDRLAEFDHRWFPTIGPQ